MRRSSLFTLVLALAAGLALEVAPSAQAANFPANPGFEVSCGGVPPVPCNWTASSGSMERDTTIFHTGAASLKLTIGAGALAANALSDCNPITPGSPSLSFWYRTADANVTSVFLLVLVYTSSNCSGFFQNAGGPMTIFPTTDGAWHQLGPTSVTVPAGANSAKLSIGDECTSTCAGTIANFDDVATDIPLAVTLASFTGSRSAKGVRLRWHTGTEVGTIGFVVYRQRNGRRVRLNRHLIPALSLTRGGISGGAYSYLDRRAPRHARLRYWLQEVAANGSRTWYGPVRIGSA